jgi:peroxiredoxin
MKKTCGFIVAVASFFLAFSTPFQNGFSISAHITSVPDNTVVLLQNLASGQVLDSCLVKNERFKFKGVMPTNEPEELRIIPATKEWKKGIFFYTDLLIRNENLQLTADISDLPHNVSTSGSASMTQAEQYHKSLYQWEKKKTDLAHLLKATPDSLGKLALQKQIRQTTDSLNEWQLTFIKENFNSYIALVLYHYRRDLDAATLTKLYVGLSRELKQSKYGRSIETQIQFPRPKVGDSYYDFVAERADGTSYKLSDLKGKYILLQFAGTGCYYSSQSMEEMKSLYKNKKDSVSFVSFFVDPQKEDWKAYDAAKKIPWSSLWHAGGKYSEINNKYGIVGTPTFFLIAPTGKILSTWFGFEEGLIKSKLTGIF